MDPGALPGTGPVFRRLLGKEREFLRKVADLLKILLQIGVVFGVYWLSQCIEAILPIVFPASVISLLLLLALLILKVVKVDHIREKADFLLGNLGFFFVPAGVSIMNYANIIWENAGAFCTICVVSTILTYGATVTVVHLTGRLMAGKETQR